MFTVAQLHLYSIYTAFEITILDIKHMFYTYVDTWRVSQNFIIFTK